MDYIEIRRLEVFARHGCFPEENINGQYFYVSVRIDPASGSFAATDQLDKTVNYDELCCKITQWMTENTFNLIETCSSFVAEKILMEYSGAGRAVVEIEKPQAPVSCKMETVLAHAERSWHTVYLGIGSNMGRREEFLQEALHMLKVSRGIQVTALSSIYETEPYGVTDQPAFLNGCIGIRTWLDPEALLVRLHEIEYALGRVREMHWGPRTIDLDILLYDRDVIDTADLHIPHIDMGNRLFVLQPLSEIAGFYRHPISGITIDEMLVKLQESKRSDT